VCLAKHVRLFERVSGVGRFGPPCDTTCNVLGVSMLSDERGLSSPCV